jgi:D-lactate dehydrogenase (cytochrome)
VISGGHCTFPDVRSACLATIETIQSGIPVARIELLDTLQVKACNAYSKLTLPETPMLFVEFHGSAASVAEQSRQFGEIAAGCGGGPFAWTTDPEARTKLWQARHDAYWASIGLRPGARAFATDVCVPISRLADCMEETQADIAQSGLIAPIVGHVGDGNFHIAYLVDPNRPEERELAERLNQELVQRAIEVQGTCSGEHGIGLHKMDFLFREAGEGAISMMRTLKRALDPKNIMNPGKIFTL